MDLYIPAGKIFAQAQKVHCIHAAVAGNVSSYHIDGNIPAGKVFTHTEQISCIADAVRVDITRNPHFDLDDSVLDLEINFTLINIVSITGIDFYFRISIGLYIFTHSEMKSGIYMTSGYVRRSC